MPTFSNDQSIDIDRPVDDQTPTPPTAPTPTPSDTSGNGSGEVGSVPTASDPSTGSDGSGTGALSPQIAPAVVIGLDLLRDASLVVTPEAALSQEPTVELLSKERRLRSRYTERKKVPITSGINL
jgi:hypothetical protein